ncbi:hypothetical protein I6L35_04780 [Aeromonas sp. FDAARGOS 1405]|uniref:hypothetical protein n=1 Tax=Aeromonas TaxID=642 RepID=UPI001117B61B|nr:MULTISPECIES: hypothetical protein [Aeromonas]QXB30501.1 hypothetical protein I6L35_04780 [Aeromonas sp. FDAARGOS 1405]TNI81785.1 hypothetical protein CF116_07365 [Aeromonas veronii]
MQTEYIDVLKLILSWPTIVLIAILVLRKPILDIASRLTSSDNAKIKLGVIEADLGTLTKKGNEVIDNLNRLNVVMAESRLFELNVTCDKLKTMFSEEEHERMQQHISALQELLSRVNKVEK